MSNPSRIECPYCFAQGACFDLSRGDIYPPGIFHKERIWAALRAESEPVMNARLRKEETGGRNWNLK